MNGKRFFAGMAMVAVGIVVLLILLALIVHSQSSTVMEKEIRLLSFKLHRLIERLDRIESDESNLIIHEVATLASELNLQHLYIAESWREILTDRDRLSEPVMATSVDVDGKERWIVKAGDRHSYTAESLPQGFINIFDREDQNTDVQ